jgi:hypothetical protein
MLAVVVYDAVAGLKAATDCKSADSVSPVVFVARLTQTAQIALIGQHYFAPQFNLLVNGLNRTSIMSSLAGSPCSFPRHQDLQVDCWCHLTAN